MPKPLTGTVNGKIFLRKWFLKNTIFYVFLPGSAFLSLSPLQISALSVISGRLWVGTGSGAVFSVPLSLGEFFSFVCLSFSSNLLKYVEFAWCSLFVLFCPTGSESSIPYCTLASAQLCFHGHRQAVKFIISAPGDICSKNQFCFKNMKRYIMCFLFRAKFSAWRLPHVLLTCFQAAVVLLFQQMVVPLPLIWSSVVEKATSISVLVSHQQSFPKCFYSVLQKYSTPWKAIRLNYKWQLHGHFIANQYTPSSHLFVSR